MLQTDSLMDAKINQIARLRTGFARSPNTSPKILINYKGQNAVTVSWSLMNPAALPSYQGKKSPQMKHQCH